MLHGKFVLISDYWVFITELGLRVQLEQTQRHFTRRLCEQDVPDYDARLSELGAMSLAAMSDFIN